MSKFYDCPDCHWPVPRDDKGVLPFLCPACGYPMPGHSVEREKKQAKPSASVAGLKGVKESK